MKVCNIIPYFKDNLASITHEKEIVSWAYIVIESILAYTKSDTIIYSDSYISKSNTDKIINIVKELSKNKPIQYILGEAYFYGLYFKVNRHTLIPRPETEELVKWILQYNFQSVLDVGTGSGCIAISLAKNLSLNTFILDNSKEALEIAKFNADKHQVPVNLLHQDILKITELPKVDVIVSNPPYVELSDCASIKPNVINYEPYDAIFAPSYNSLIFYHKIILLSKFALNQNGLLFFEINEKYSSEISDILKKNHFVDITLKKDINDKFRMIKATKK